MKKAFTLAEILITLTVIGIVAAISIPSLIANINEKTWNVQRKALFVRLENAISDMPKIKGFGDWKAKTDDSDAVDTGAESFIVEGLSKVYKINNICSSANIDKCGLPLKYAPLFGSAKKDFPTNINNLAISNNYTKNTSAAAIQTANGESIAVYYNSDCLALKEGVNEFNVMNRICANFIYDLNGQKAPNQVGKDIGFITVLYRNKLTVVAPNFYESTMGTAASYAEKDEDGNSKCKSKDKGLRLPTIDELMALSANARFVGGDFPNYVRYLSSTVLTPGADGDVYSINLSIGGGSVATSKRSTNLNLVCVYE